MTAAETATSPSSDRCLDCGAPRLGPFCHTCGQRGRLHNRLRDLAEEVVESVAHLDGRLFRTLPLLVFRPGALSRAWRDGRRTRFMPPIHVFLFGVFFLFLAASLSGQALVFPPNVAPGAIFEIEIEDKTDRAPELVRSIERYFEGSQEESKLAAYKAETLLYKTSIAFVPLCVLVLALVMIGRKGATLYDHAVVSLYGVGFGALVVALLLLLRVWLPGWVAGAFALGLAVHAVSHLRGFYGLGPLETALRGALLVLLCAGVAFIFVLAAIAVGAG